MKIQAGHLVPLGYGKYVRSDRIVGLEPIEEDRGPGRRTWVYVEQLDEPLVASRSEGAILRDAVEPGAAGPQAQEQRQVLRDVLDTLEGLDPVLRRIVRDQAGWDLGVLEDRIRQTLAGELE
jgi:hypothetical protein